MFSIVQANCPNRPIRIRLAQLRGPSLRSIASHFPALFQYNVQDVYNRIREIRDHNDGIGAAGRAVNYAPVNAAVFPVDPLFDAQGMAEGPMPEINMVAATANQTIDPMGREKAIMAGANVIMPNLTPNEYREDYLIYPDKACVSDKPEECFSCLDIRMKAIGHKILYNAWGDSVAFTKKKK